MATKQSHEKPVLTNGYCLKQHNHYLIISTVIPNVGSTTLTDLESLCMTQFDIFF